MEITVKIQADELAGAINNLAEALLVDNNNLAESINNLALSVGPIEAVKTEPKKVARGSQKVEDKPKPTEPPKAEPKEEPKTEPKEEPKAEPKEEPKAEKDEPQYKIEDIRTAFATFAKVKGKDKAKEILAQFNAHKVTELKEDDYNAVMKVLEG